MKRYLPMLALLTAVASAWAQESEVGLVNGAFEGDADNDGIADGWHYESGGPAEHRALSRSLLA